MNHLTTITSLPGSRKMHKILDTQEGKLGFLVLIYTAELVHYSLGILLIFDFCLSFLETVLCSKIFTIVIFQRNNIKHCTSDLSRIKF